MIIHDLCASCLWIGSWLKKLLSHQGSGYGHIFQYLIYRSKKEWGKWMTSARRLREQWTGKLLQESRTRTQLKNVPHSQSKPPSQLLPSQVSKFTWIIDCWVFPNLPLFKLEIYSSCIIPILQLYVYIWGAANLSF